MGIIRNILHRHKQATTNYLLYNNCSTLPMLRFIALICNNDYKQLIIIGNPPQSVLEQTWEQVYEQYLNLCSGDESIYLYKLQLKVDQKKLFIEALTFLQSILHGTDFIPGMSSKVAQRLNKMMILMKLSERFTLQPETLKEELQLLRIIINEATLELNELLHDLEAAKKKGDGSSLREDHFYEWATIMSQYYQFNIQVSQLTVTEFEGYRKRYRKAVQQQKNKKVA